MGLLQGCQWGILGEVQFYFHNFTFPLSKWSGKIHVLEVLVHLAWTVSNLNVMVHTAKGLVEENARIFSDLTRLFQFRIISQVFNFFFSFPFLGLMYLRMIFPGNLWLTDFLLSYFFLVTGNAEFFQYLDRWDSFAENEMDLRYLMEVKCKSLVITKFE